MADIEDAKIRWGDPNSDAVAGVRGVPNISTIDVNAGIVMPNVQTALNKWQRRQFNYGDADCCQFAAFIVNEMTGKNYASQFEYESEAQAEVLVGREGS